MAKTKSLGRVKKRNSKKSIAQKRRRERERVLLRTIPTTQHFVSRNSEEISNEPGEASSLVLDRRIFDEALPEDQAKQVNER